MRYALVVVRKLTFFFTGLLLASSIAYAQDAEAPDAEAHDESAQRSEEELKADIASFDQVWSTIRDRNWDKEFDFEKWDAQKAKLRPNVEASDSIATTRSVIRKLLASLEKSHYALLPSDLYNKIKTTKEEKAEKEDETDEDVEDVDGECGLFVRLIDDQAVVTRVEPNSSAAKAGIKPGWIVKEHDGLDVSEMYAELKEELDESSHIRVDTIAALAMEGKLEDTVGETVDLVFLDCQDEEREITLTFEKPNGSVITFGHIPTMVIKSRSDDINDGIGYVWFNMFFDPANVMKDMKRAVKIARNGRGIIIDMRGNRGGLGGMTMGVGNHFVTDKESYLGTLSTKDSNLKFVLFRRAKPYEGPVAVLIDECSISSAEILAGGLQAIGRARVFGVTSAGAALPSTFEKLPNGDRFQFAIAGYKDFQGRNIEGNGVTPDEPIKLERSAFVEGHDPILEAAISWIDGQALSNQE